MAALALLALMTGGMLVLALHPPAQPVASTDSSETASDPSDGDAASVARDDALTISDFGDSITQGDSENIRDGITGPTSWIHHLDGSRIRYVGGQSVGGQTAEQAAAGEAQPVRADVQVAFLGTNDIRDAMRRTSPDSRETGEYVKPAAARFVSRTADYLKAADPGADPANVVIIALGPNDVVPTKDVTSWNSAVRQECTRRDWRFVDPWTPLRATGNTYADRAMTSDGLHPSVAGARVLAEELTQQLTK